MAARELIDRYREQIDHVLFEPDAGPADGLNKGFALATGDIYCYLNSDDVFETDAFRRVADFLRETPIYMSSADMLGSSTKLVIGFEEFGQFLHSTPCSIWGRHSNPAIDFHSRGGVSPCRRI